MIPKTIHQIHMGDSKLTSKEIEWQQTWKQHNPHWKHVMWTDAKIAKDLKITHQDIFDDCKSYSEKSDVLRFEILYQYGGLYIDTDFECLKSIDSLFIDSEIVIYRESHKDVCGAFFAARKHNPHVKKLIDALPARKKSHGHKAANIKYGPEYLHEYLPSEIVRNDTKTVYPYLWNEKHRAKENFKKTSPGAYAVHHWNKSW